MAKGMMFSMGFFFLASLLLVVGMLTLLSAQETEERAIDTGILTKIADYHSSLGKAVRDIYMENGPANFSIHNNSVSIIETIPSPDTASLSTSLNNFITFVEADEPLIMFNNSNFFLYTISPYGFNYSLGGGSYDTITLNPRTLNYDRYDFTFDVGNAPIGNINFVTSSAGSFPLNIQTINGSDHTVNASENVIISDDIIIQLENIDPDSNRIVNITIFNQTVTIFNNLSTSLESNVTILFDGQDTARVEYPKFISMLFTGFNLSKTSSIILAE